MNLPSITSESAATEVGYRGSFFNNLIGNLYLFKPGAKTLTEIMDKFGRLVHSAGIGEVLYGDGVELRL